MDGEEEEDEEGGEISKPASELFQLSGTLLDQEKTPSFPVTIIDNDEQSIQNALMAADIIIYSIAEGEFVAEVQMALDFIQTEAVHFISQKCFVLVSFCLTWNKSKPLDIDDPEIPFTEDDYRLVLNKYQVTRLSLYSERDGHHPIIKITSRSKNWLSNSEKH